MFASCVQVSARWGAVHRPGIVWPALPAAISSVFSVFDNFLNLLTWMSVTIVCCAVSGALPMVADSCRQQGVLIVVHQQQNDAVVIAVNGVRARSAKPGKMIGEVMTDDRSEEIRQRLLHRQRPFRTGGGMISAP